MNLICRMFGHKTIKRKYGNKYGSGEVTGCSRCRIRLWDFKRNEIKDDTLLVGLPQMGGVESTLLQGEHGNETM